MQNITAHVSVNYASAHFNRRKFDGVYEIVARAEVGADGRFPGKDQFIVIDTQPNRVKAVEAVRQLRAKATR